MQPTNEQSSILSTLRTTPGNLSIRALAGSGKTSTLEMIQNDATECPILCLAFNKRIAEEMSKRFRSTTTVRTFNSLGHRIWSKTCTSTPTLNPKKMQDLFREHCKTLRKSAADEAWSVYWEVIHACGLAKSLGYIPTNVFPNARRLLDEEVFYESLDERPTAQIRDLCDTLLINSIKQAYAGTIDYNDQIYMPALFGGTFPQFPLVLVDEAQDLSPTNHAMLNRMARSRICIVGDVYQSIYGFRGAVQGGMKALEAKFDMAQSPLSISFRCPQRIVENVHWRVPHMRWANEGGHVEHLGRLTLDGIQEGSAIICRNNAPLFQLAFHLLAAGRSVRVAGSDIGPKLIGILRRLGEEDLSRSAVVTAIAQWQVERESKGSTSAADMAECLRIFASFGTTLGSAIAYAEHLFKQEGTIRLLTGHKAKGLEWDIVYFLDPWLIGEEEQELNLRYVISTRAKRELFEIDSRNIR